MSFRVRELLTPCSGVNQTLEKYDLLILYYSRSERDEVLFSNARVASVLFECVSVFAYFLTVLPDSQICILQHPLHSEN